MPTGQIRQTPDAGLLAVRHRPDRRRLPADPHPALPQAPPGPALPAAPAVDVRAVGHFPAGEIPVLASLADCAGALLTEGGRLAGGPAWVAGLQRWLGGAERELLASLRLAETQGALMELVLAGRGLREVVE